MAAPLSCSGPVVLVVDDEATVLRLMQRALDEAGFRVSAAPDGIRAMDLAATLPTPPELLVTDVSMRPIDGVALAALVRGRWPDARVLFVTGFDASHRVLPGPVLEKPFGPTELVSVVGRLLADPEPLSGVGA
jgi:DNA-binding response OmpR family regulator